MRAIFRSIFLAAALATTASAGLVKQNFLTPNDGLLIQDTVTNLEWLTPVYTKGNTYNNVFVQGILSTYGFRYATATEVTNMVNSNFGNPTTVANGNTAGFTAAGQFFGYFGIAEQVRCGGLPCPWTQGLTSTVGNAGTHLAFGMIQLGSTGWFITNNHLPDTFADTHLGSWLVRTAAPPVGTPEPGSMALMGLGLAGLAIYRAKRAA